MNDMLKEIKESIKDEISPVVIGDHVTWLIKQAEQLEEAQRIASHADGYSEIYKDEYEKLEVKYREQAKRIAELEAELEARPVITPTKYKHIEPFK